MGKVYTRIQTKNGAKTLPDGAADTHVAYIREYHPPPVPDPERKMTKLLIFDNQLRTCFRD